MNAIPDWLGNIVGLAILGVLGWIGRVAYLAWQDHKKPYEQDQERFSSIIRNIDPYSFAAFQKVDIGDFSASDSENLMKALGEIDLIGKFEKSCIDKELLAKEQILVKCLNKITEYIAYKSFYRGRSDTRRTFLWDSFDSSVAADLEASKKIQGTIECYGRELFEAFVEYKKYGDVRFATKISSN